MKIRSIAPIFPFFLFSLLIVLFSLASCDNPTGGGGGGNGDNPAVVTIAAIPGVTAPVTGGTPVTAITETAQYSGTIAWNGNPSTFAAGTAYAATITLTAKSGFTLQGVVANFFTVAGAASVSNAANSGEVTAVFLQTTLVEMVQIPGGTFMMGSPLTEPDHEGDEIQHSVTLTSFWMGKYEVTQAQYQTVVGSLPNSLPSSSYGVGDNYPVYYVSWYDAVEFCNALSEKEGLTPYYTIDKTTSDPNNTNSSDTLKWLVTGNTSANGYRLPTEAQWEYACRAGTSGPFNTGDNITTDQANYNGNYPYNNNATGVYRERTIPVGTFAPNAWGLYDMHGNVREWCWDWYGTYSSDVQTDLGGAASGALRVARGGSWSGDGQDLRSAYRDLDYPNYGDINLGFRLVRPAQ